MSDGALILLLILIAFVGIVIFLIIVVTAGKNPLLDQEKYRVKWLKIENGLDQKNPTTYQFAVLAADKLLDQAMKETGIAGENMGARLKNAKNRFAKIDHIWTAHKLRNKIAHESDVNVSLRATRQALAIYKRALREIGAI